MIEVSIGLVGFVVGFIAGRLTAKSSKGSGGLSRDNTPPQQH